jgi:uncharacterized protein (DUF2141 family)
MMDRRIKAAMMTGVLVVTGLGLWTTFRPHDCGEVFPYPQFRSASEDVVRSPTTVAVAPISQEIPESSAGKETILAVDELPVPVETADPGNIAADEGAVAGRLRQVPVTIQGLKSVDALVHVAVFESATGFPNVVAGAATTTVAAAAQQVDFSLELKRDAVIAIAVFQDLDGNKVLTKNALGIPVEPYGFSNNVRGTFGPPRFDKAKLMVADALESLEIRVR